MNAESWSRLLYTRTVHVGVKVWFPQRRQQTPTIKKKKKTNGQVYTDHGAWHKTCACNTRERAKRVNL
jgi:cyanate permease